MRKFKHVLAEIVESDGQFEVWINCQDEMSELRRTRSVLEGLFKTVDKALAFAERLATWVEYGMVGYDPTQKRWRDGQWLAPEPVRGYMDRPLLEGAARGLEGLASREAASYPHEYRDYSDHLRAQLVVRLSNMLLRYLDDRFAQMEVDFDALRSLRNGITEESALLAVS